MVVLVFPAYAGMSPAVWRSRAPALSFPRLRGDEPVTMSVLPKRIGFSPPTRG